MMILVLLFLHDPMLKHDVPCAHPVDARLLCVVTCLCVDLVYNVPAPVMLLSKQAAGTSMSQLT